MSAPPLTVLTASPDEAEEIRRRVRTVNPASLHPSDVLAGPEHVAGLTAMLRDPAVSAPIYDLPRPINADTIAAWVASSARDRETGDALLLVTLDEKGEVAGYSRFTIWPERASGELAGGRRADRQNSGGGSAGAARSFAWMFETLGVRLIGLTAALDNVRSARLIEAAGFIPMGERETVRPDGSVRRSLYWELSREQWRARAAPRE